MTDTASAAAPSDRYLTDAVYPDFFHREMTPAWLYAAATALGRRAPDPGLPYTWMELGCGAGLGAVLTAAANPHGQFIGVDVNAQHVAAARAHASAAGIGNVTFRHDDFLRLASDPAADEPACDFIVLHGVYAWVSADVQLAIRQIVQRWLKPGGLLYLGYMSHPGNSAFVAAQRLMRLHAQQSPAASDTQAPAALQFLQQLARTGAGYFSANPGVAQQLDRVAQEDTGYLAHEFLNDHWQPLHVADVMAQLTEAGCRYIGSASLLENIDAVSIPESVQALLRTLTDVPLAETVRDLARHQHQRRDIYQRIDGSANGHTLTPDGHRERLMAQVIAPLPGLPARGPLVIDTRIGPVEASDVLFTPLLQALQHGPQLFADMAQLPAYRTQPGFLNQACQTLYGGGAAHPAPSSAAISAAPSWRLNRRLSALPGARCWLAAPGLGTALAVMPLQKVAAKVLLDSPALRGESLWQAVAAEHQRQAMGMPEQLDKNLLAFEQDVLPSWRHYGVVPRAPRV